MKDLTPALFKATTEVLTKKAQDYNADRINDPDFRLDDKRTEYFPFGDQSYVHMLWTKILRIKNLVGKADAPNFEGIEDSLIDLCAYSAFYYTYLQDKKDAKSKVAKRQLLLENDEYLKLLDQLRGDDENQKLIRGGLPFATTIFQSINPNDPTMIARNEVK